MSGQKKEQLLHHLFERQAREAPHGVALRCADRIMTYGELNERADRLAQSLSLDGIRCGHAVSILLPRGIEMYVAILGILKSGAAYVPLDPEYPQDRIEFILKDCRATALITTPALERSAGGFRGKIFTGDLSDVRSSRRQEALERISGTDLCYIIYTSGSTGWPKGVEIEHHSACHFVESELKLFGLAPEDRVYQGFSIAFDASVEEIWLALASGASLVVGTDEVRRSGPELPARLREAQVTVLSVVPSLLAMFEEDVPSVRLLIFGGEVCPPTLARKWLRPGRRVFNTYGPTEATVVATVAELSDGGAVTIGKPLGDCNACLLDEQLRPVPPGEAGELCLGGPGLARGYIGQPELTGQKFIRNPDSAEDSSAPRLYRTGDLARWNNSGDLEFLGRIDTQVKIRGFRVELSEIESILLEHPDIQSAAVVLLEDAPGLQQLIAYIVARDDKLPEDQFLKDFLRQRLPAYMIPAGFERLAGLPTLPSGKVDRKSLPRPHRRAGDQGTLLTGRTDRERRLEEAWSKWFGSKSISLTDDFFLDLGGHSLLAARVVSELRRCKEFGELSVADIYHHPTIAALAAEFERRGKQASRPDPDSRKVPASRPAARPVPASSHFLCGLAQFLSLFFVLTFFALQWLTPYLTYTLMVEEEYEIWEAILGAMVSLMALYPVMLLIPVALKWLLIGRYRAGVYPLWGGYFFRWWLVTTVEAAVPVGYLEGTPLLNIYLRLMGAKIGDDVYIGTSHFAIYDLLSIGSRSSVNADASLLGYTVEGGWLKIGRITIGSDCFIGTRACLRQETAMEDGASLEDLSVLPAATKIGAGQTWSGSPAVERGCPSRSPNEEMRSDTHAATLKDRTSSDSRASEEAPRRSPVSLTRRFWFGVLHAIGLLIFPVLISSALFPGIVFMNSLNYRDPYYGYLWYAPLVGLSFVVLLCLEIVLIKWIAVGRVKEGRYPLHSLFYLRKWFFDQTMALSLDILGPIYASVYLRPWYRALGADVASGAEISTASFASPDLLHVGEESFVADAVSLGAPRVKHGIMELRPVRIGRRSFIGNSAVMNGGSEVGEEVLIGCLSRMPDDPAQALKADSSWMGSPAVFLPQRQRTLAFSERQTFNPLLRMRMMRAIIELVRMIAPSTGFIALISLLFSVILLLRDNYSLWQTLALFPLLYASCAIVAASISIALKWALVWRYRPGECPLWSTFVWRNELLNALHEHFAGPFVVDALTGTPFICWYFRLLGARIGRRVYMETSDLSEFDLVTIGDEAAINSDATLQTHLFEDRVMKMSTITLGRGISVGSVSLVLYDSEIQQGASLGASSLLMKGETLPENSHWEGIPARPAL